MGARGEPLVAIRRTETVDRCDVERKVLTDGRIAAVSKAIA